MSIHDHSYSWERTTSTAGDVVTTTTATDHTGVTHIGTPYDSDFFRKQQELELAKRSAEQDMIIRELMNDLHRKVETPFEETEDFRDFVVWLCGFTEGHKPPDEEQWEALRDKVKQVAAKFALKARDRARKELRERTAQIDAMNQASAWYNTTASSTLSPLSTSGVTGSSVLQGNEEMITITGAKYAKSGTSKKKTY